MDVRCGCELGRQAVDYVDDVKCGGMGMKYGSVPLGVFKGLSCGVEQWDSAVEFSCLGQPLDELID